ncbi:MAG: hypothetical protein WDM79_14240 [Terricaulis sp.]
MLSFGGRPVADSRALTRMVGEAQVGAKVPIEIFRDGRRYSIEATIARLDEPDSPRVAAREEGDSPPVRSDGGPRGGRVFGVGLSELDASLREEFQIEPDVAGLVVLTIDPGEDAENKLRPGDVIERIGFEPVDTIAAARAIAGRAAIGEHAVVVRVNREGRITYRSLASVD